MFRNKRCIEKVKKLSTGADTVAEQRMRLVVVIFLLRWALAEEGSTYCGEVNDDYCDCLDGSDEPRTAACSRVTTKTQFYCENKGHQGRFVPLSRVQDGICDCCDGSDEGEGSCQDRCVEERDLWERAEALRLAEVQRGVGERRAMQCASIEGQERAKTERVSAEFKLKKDQERFNETETQLTQLRSTVDLKRDTLAKQRRVEDLLLDKLSIDQLRDLLIDVLSDARLDKAQIQAKVRDILGLPEPTVAEDENATTTEEATTEEATTETKIEEGTTEEATAEEVHDDEATAVPTELEDHASALFDDHYDEEEDDDVPDIPPPPPAPEEEEEEEEDDDESVGDISSFGGHEEEEEDIRDDEDEIPDYVFPDEEEDREEERHDEEYDDHMYHYDDYHHHLDDDDYDALPHREEEKPKTELALEKYYPEEDVYMTRREKRKIRKLESKVDKLKKKVKKREDRIAKNDVASGDRYGKDGVFWPLRDFCTSKVARGYKYEVCLFQKAKQDSNRLGDFSESTLDAKGRVIGMTFKNGAYCYNGPARSMTVTFVCGTETTLVDIDEPETCVYSATMATPAACFDDDDTCDIDCENVDTASWLSTSRQSKKKKKKKKKKRKHRGSPVVPEFLSWIWF